MKYERLTEKDSCYYDEMDRLDVDEIYNRLAELEDKIEQGTLIELPCKVGDTVYEIIPKCEGGGLQCPYSGGFGFDRCDKYGCNAFVKETEFTFYMREKYGKTVFTTREKAEKRLKELQE